jgi:Cu(I)/Ag(I) efflux system membrane protein CusA/SilA
VIFDKKPGLAEVDVVNEAKSFLESKLKSGELVMPEGVTFSFAGSYENQLRAKNRLMFVIPTTLLFIFLILYLMFRSSIVACLIFTGVFIAWSGGFIMLWLYAQDWFLNISVLGLDFRELFQIRQYNLSVAVWVGFIALFGIATDDGVLIATYIKQNIKRLQPQTKEDLRVAILQAASRRVRPALMTSATTILALLPVITSTGRGSEIMAPMAIPSFGGMTMALLTLLSAPVLYCAVLEFRLKRVGNADL